jgi:hypothetical protein
MNTPDPDDTEAPEEGPNLKFAAIVSTVLLSVVLIAVLYLRSSQHLAPEIRPRPRRSTAPR